ncbi:unnamed protein product [Cercopithifilaria johnstoni]|uniref:Uncharacterized protein n=1 Tax=Cercopithifilaria johnstoni TaxID=2874296 RepID=A0A8J2LV32_9BILA|nr:unnamed protein product [Cercopithifilaria johnstoni]
MYYWSVVTARQLTTITVVISFITNTNTFACFSSGFCSCPTAISGCPCAKHAFVQTKSYIAPSISHVSSHQLPSLVISPSSYSASYPSYMSYQSVPLARISYPQRYNFPYTYNAPQSLSQQSMVPSLSSHNSQRSTGNIMGISKNYNQFHHAYGIHSKKLPPNTITEVPLIYESQKHSNEYNENMEQIEVAPSIISSENINDNNQMTTQRLQRINNIHAVVTLPVQNVSNQQHSMIAAINIKQMTATNDTNADVEMNEKMNYQNPIVMQRRIYVNQNVSLKRRPLDDTKNRHEGKLPLCSRKISESGNHNIECITLSASSISSKINDGLKNSMEAYTLNDKQFDEANSKLNIRRVNIPNVRSNIRIIPRTESFKHLKFFNAASLRDNHHVPIVLQQNHQDSNKFFQKYRNSKNVENMSQKGMNINSIGTEKYIGQNRKVAYAKPTFKEASSSGWTRKNDRLLRRRFEKMEELNNATKWIDYENRFYTTYHHHTCTGRILGYLRNGTIASVAQKCEELECDATNVRLSEDHILEITFLKNVTGYFRNYGNYCVSKKSVRQVNFDHVVIGTNALSKAHRFYNKSLRDGNTYRAYREANKSGRFVRPILIDGTAKVF